MMKKLGKRLCSMVISGLLITLSACGGNAGAVGESAGPAEPPTAADAAARDSGQNPAARDVTRNPAVNLVHGASSDPAQNLAQYSDEEQGQTQQKTLSFADVTDVKITGYLQHFEVAPASGDEVVLRWTSAGDEVVAVVDGHLTLAFAEPDWLSKDLPNDGTPRFSVVSTIYVELPDHVETAEFYSTLGDITVDAVKHYGVLKAETCDGNVTVRGVTGRLTANTGRGTIAPESFAPDIVESTYSLTTKSKRLDTTIPGAENPNQKTVLFSESGKISINE